MYGRGLYKLDGHAAVPCEDVEEWAQWYETANRRVAQENVRDVHISTVFLGVDHLFTENGAPVLFETMVFGGPLDQEQERCSTWEEAEHMHAVMVMRVKDAMKEGR